MLEGIRVLDVATLAAAPLAATYLGEFGADVIKIEQPDGGDPIRTWGNQVDGVGLMWKSLSRNKRSITLNLRVAEGQALLRRLVEHADVVIVNTRPATLRKWGLDYPALRAVNDKIVMLHITGYGLTGPKSERPGFGTLGEAMSGFANITGEAEGPADVAAVHACRRGGVAQRRLRGDDGALPPRRARRARAVDRHQPDRPAGAAAGADTAGLRPARPGADQGGQPLGHLGAAQHLPHRRRSLAGDVGQLTARWR